MSKRKKYIEHSLKQKGYKEPLIAELARFTSALDSAMYSIGDPASVEECLNACGYSASLAVRVLAAICKTIPEEEDFNVMARFFTAVGVMAADKRGRIQ